MLTYKGFNDKIMLQAVTMLRKNKFIFNANN